MRSEKMQLMALVFPHYIVHAAPSNTVIMLIQDELEGIVTDLEVVGVPSYSHHLFEWQSFIITALTHNAND
ncbi:MAG: hypothetical protein ACREV4_06930 [Gammaproteobacteria bacterium]